MVDIFLDKIIWLYNFVACCGIMMAPVQCSDENRKKDVEDNGEEKWKSRFRIFMVILLLAIAIVLIFVSVIKECFGVIGLIYVLACLLETNQVYDSLSVIRVTISRRGGDELNKKEIEAILMLASALLMLNNYKMPKRVFYLSQHISNEVVSDWVTIVVAVLLVTLYSFLIGVLILIPIKVFYSFVRNIKVPVILEIMKVQIVRCRESMLRLIWNDFLCIRLIDWTLQQKKGQRVILVFLLILIPIDLSLKIIFIGLGILLIIIEYPFFMIRRICTSLLQLIEWIESLSNRKVINIIFRFAFVVAVSFVVAVNRYDSFLHRIKESTGVLEFVSSAVVIPMIFTWIIDYKTAKMK